MCSSGEVPIAPATPVRRRWRGLLALLAVLACTWPPRAASAQDAGCDAPSAAAACLAGASTVRDGRDRVGAAPAAGVPFLPVSLAPAPAESAPLPARAYRGDVRRGAWSGLRWGALIGAVVGAGWCAVDAECRDDGGGAIFETAVFTGVSGAALGALVGAVMGAVRD